MTLLVAICVAVIFGVGVYLMTSRELKSVAMGVFILGHAANLGILAMSGQPLFDRGDGRLALKGPPILGAGEVLVDPLPQALILTAIVISFAVMGFLLTLLVVTRRKTGTISLELLREDGMAEMRSEGAGLA
jgi:multicomponent Na+:H+ antiporter subunit C